MNALFREKSSNVMTNVERARILSLVSIIKSFLLSRSGHRSGLIKPGQMPTLPELN